MSDFNISNYYDPIENIKATNNFNIPFTPVRGNEAKILAADYRDGYIYYAIDTKKIYLDANGQSKIPMGGNSGIFYGQMILEETPDSAQKEFDFTVFDIEGNENLDKLNIPGENDLILNIPDGCFYRVIGISGEDIDTIISTEKLTISGSGSNTVDPNVGSYTLDRLTDSTVTTLFGSSYSIGFKTHATDASGEQTGSVTYRLLVGGVEKERGTIPQGPKYLDVSPYLSLGQNTIKVIVSLDIGSSENVTANKTWTITTTQMELDWNPHENGIEIYNTLAPLTLTWKVSGVGINKTTYLTIDDTYFIEMNSTSSTGIQSYKIENPNEFNLSHGAHKFAMRAGTLLEGAVDEDFTPYIYHNLMFQNPLDASPIIRMDLFNTTLTQYNTISIPVYFFSEDNIMNNASLILKEDGIEKDVWENVINKTENIWTYTPTIAGTHILSIHCGEVEVSKIINVTALDINNEEVPEYAFKFKASDFASNNAVQNWNSNNTTATFSQKFDWNNGGLKTEKDESNGNRQYFSIKAGSTMTINYPLWAQNAPGYGKTLKIIFKTANCRDYDAQVLSCKNDKKVIEVDKNIEYLMYFDNGITLTTSKLLTLNNSTIELNNPIEAIYDLTSEESRAIFEKSYIIFEDEVYECHFIESEKENDNDPTLYYAVWYKTSVVDSFEGLLLNAQAAVLKSRSNVISTQYCEDSYIELEFDITKYDKNNIKNYMKFWIDGVPSGYTIYSSDDTFTGADKIVIGSVDCDVHIYMIKLYERALTNDEHLQNFIADAPNAEEMIKRFKRNDILDERNEISPTLLAKANKDCLVHVYEIDRMTRTKKDKVPYCTYDQYHGSDQVALHAENVTIKVQGTSSEKYVVSAANIDSDFYDVENGATGFIDTTTGTELGESGWSMDGGTAIPCNYFCTKVNVASCENANNALNQEWYNLFQPYKSVLRCKNPNARDTMQFTNGVLFMKDKNQTFNTDAIADKKLNNLFGEIDGYLNSPYPKFYSLANMGNSKDNIHVFHDTLNPLECCIEVKDNQTQQQQMISDVYNKADIGEDEDYFEFRYPDGVKNASSNMIDGWNKFVTWMATSNPQPRYEKHVATTEKEFKTFSYNQKTHKNVPTYILNEDKTAYILTKVFIPEINTYYTETDHIYGYTNLPLESPISYGDYTFRGYRAENQKDENGELWQKNYTPMIKDCVVTQYKGTYTHDTYKYRMAKMLHECEDHLVMDSIIYHYLFIERHCMIDNVAKNTFWSTEDCQHWNLIKDYDNDTADGNDNNGKFTRNYGMEPLDMLNANIYVFNAHQSVWLNFIYGLQEAREHMYQKLEEKTVRYNGRDLSIWSKDDYLWLFKEWQSRIPERCWIEDYYRKYFRPYELYNDTMFNSMMEGGQKTHQRKQYETYQETYISSEYNGKDCRSSYMLVRSNGKNMLGYELPVEVYSDCYIRMDTGSDTSVQRVKRNTRANFICPTNNLTNATMYFYPAKAFSLIGDVNGGKLGEMLPEQVSFAQAGKLRELVVATPDSTVNVTLKKGFSVLNNNLLEKLYVSNLGAYEEGLDLSKCPNLLEVNAIGSTFTSVEIANNAPITTIKLEAPTSLTLSNLTELQTLQIEDYRRLTGLKLNNIDNSEINSKDIVETAIEINNALTGNYSLDYTLTNVNWIMNESNDVVNDKITLLEYLLTKCQPNWNEDRTDREPLSISLTGNLLIGDIAYNDSNSFNIYNTYVNKDIYPNLDINFTHPNAKLYTVDIYDGNDKVYWTRKIIKGNNIDDDFLSDGPIGAFELNRILKGSTPAYIYQFARKWEVYDSSNLENPLYTIDNDINGLPYYEDVQCDLIIKPIFNRIDRTYTLTFYGNDTTTPFAILEKVKFGTPFDSVLAQLTEIPYKEYEGSELKAAYSFSGYALLKNSETKVPKEYTVTNDQSFYAIFEFVTDITTVVHYEDWYTFIPQAYYQDQEYCNLGAIDYEEKYHKYLKPEDAYLIMPKVKLKGKITIPSTYKNKPVVCIGGFSSNKNYRGPGLEHEITHIFFEKGSQLYEILGGAFYELSTLTYFDFSQNTVRYVGPYAFQSCESLKAGLNSQGESQFQMSSETFFIGEYSFLSALQSTSVTEIKIPAKVVYMGQLSFAFQLIAEGSTLRIGSDTEPSQLQLLDPNVTISINNISKFLQNSGHKYKNIYFFSKNYDNVYDEIANGIIVQDAFFGGQNENYPNTTITIQ